MTNNRPHCFLPKLLPLLLALPGGAAFAFEPVVFENGAMLDLSAQVSYVNMKRLNGPSPVLTDAADSNAINMDDGNRTVGKHGTVSNRLSALVDINFSKDDYRAFVRASSFYDAATYGNNANNSQATFNSAAPSNQFSSEAQSLAGSRTRLLDAYVQGRWKLSQDGSYPLTVKVGRQVVAWGEGLHFMGIGGSMNPQDGLKAQIPGTPVKEMFLPSEQVSATLGVSNRLMLMGYGKWEFRETEVMPVGTYFNFADLVGPGASFMRFMAGDVLPGAWRAPDVGRKAGGQWGVGAKYQLTDATDVGLYYLRYNELAGQPEFIYGNNFWQLGQGPVSMAFLANLAPSNFRIRYMDDIKLTGASFSTKVGETNVAGEIAYRDGAPVLMSDTHYNQARAKLTNTQLSAIRLWGTDFFGGLLGVDTADAHGEIAASTINSFETQGYSGTPAVPAALKYDRNSLAYAFGVTMKYTAVFPGWDLAVPIDWMHQLKGNPGMQGWNSGLQGENDRRLGIGAKFSYKQNLELGVQLAHFLGQPDLRDHSFHTVVDRDFIAFTGTYHF